MFAVTWFDVVDDAVKIGFGAAISGLFAWIVTRQHSKAEVDKLVFERRAHMLVKVTEQYEAAYQAFLKYKDCRGFPAARQDTEADAVRATLDERLKEVAIAQSHLMLLGEQQCKRKAEGLHLAILEAELSLSSGAAASDPEQTIQVGRAVTEAREAFYQEMTKAFEHTREA